MGIEPTSTVLQTASLPEGSTPFLLTYYDWRSRFLTALYIDQAWSALGDDVVKRMKQMSAFLTVFQNVEADHR